MRNRLDAAPEGTQRPSRAASGDLLVEFPEDAMIVVGAYHLQERVPDLALEERVRGAEYHEAVEEVLLWMRRREAVLDRTPGVDRALAVMRAHARRRRATIAAVVLLCALAAAVGTLATLLVDARQDLAALEREHRDTRDALSATQEGYLVMRRELNQLQGR